MTNPNTDVVNRESAVYLDNNINVAQHLNSALEEGNPGDFLAAISDAAKARGMARIAKDAGVGRESLYKTLAPGAKPRYDTIMKLMRALGVELQAVPMQKQSRG
jgi:probable addiction module antidote protein